MKGFKRSFIGLIILALLGGYYYFYEIRYQGKREKEKKINEKIYPVKKSDIAKFVYQRGKVKIVLEKTGGTWQITSPVNTKADKKTVDSLLGTLSGLKGFRKLLDVKWDNPEFGLAKNTVRIILYDKKGKAYKAAFGSKNPTNSYFYTLKGSTKTVLLVWVYPDKLLKKDLYDFRLKKVLALPTDKVESVQFVKGPSGIALQKVKEHDWKITSPIKAKGDRYAIEGFISSATNEKVIRFLDNPPKESNIFGWEHPRMKITLSWKPNPPEKNEKVQKKAATPKEKTATILVGKDRDDTHIYVKIADNPTIMIVKKGYLKNLDKKLFNFRNKNVWNYEISDVKLVRYENPKDHLTIVIRKFPKEDIWKFTEPRKMLADTRDVENWLWDLSGLRVKQFLSKEEFSVLEGTSKPYYCKFEIVVKGKKSPLRLKLFHLDNKWIAQSVEPDWYYVLDTKDVIKTFKTVFNLKYRRILKFEDTDVARVEIKKKDNALVFRKKKKLWYRKAGGKEKKIPNIDVLNFLWELSDLKYTRLIEKMPKETLLSGKVEVKLFDTKHKPLGHLFFTAKRDGSAYIFTAEGKKEIYMIDKAGAKKFEGAYNKLTKPKKE